MVNYKMLKQEKSTGKILAKDLKVKTIKIKTLIINNALNIIFLIKDFLFSNKYL